MKFLLEVITPATDTDKTKGEIGNRILPSLKINYTAGGFNTVVNPSGRKCRLLPLKMFASFIKKDYETAAVATVVNPVMAEGLRISVYISVKM